MAWRPARFARLVRWERRLASGWWASLSWPRQPGRPRPAGLAISPYKGLAYARRYPGADHLFGRWDAVSRVDVMADAGTRLLPGLSYTYAGPPPQQLGLSVDAMLAPVPLTRPAEFAAAAFMPEAVAFQLRPAADALVVEPAGGLGILQALAGGSRRVTAVIGNPLVPAAVAAARRPRETCTPIRASTR